MNGPLRCRDLGFDMAKKLSYGVRGINCFYFKAVHPVAIRKDLRFRGCKIGV